MERQAEGRLSLRGREDEVEWEGERGGGGGRK